MPPKKDSKSPKKDSPPKKVQPIVSLADATSDSEESTDTVKGIENLDLTDWIGSVGWQSAEEELFAFLPLLFQKKGEGKYREDFVLKLGVEKMPPSIYNEHGELKPNSTIDAKWLAFSLGDEGAFWEWSLWETEELARARVEAVKRIYPTVKFLDQFCTCGRRVHFEIGCHDRKKTDGTHRELEINQDECECQRPKPKSPGKGKAKAEKTEAKPKETKKSPPKPEKKPEPEKKLTVKRASPKKKPVSDDE